MDDIVPCRSYTEGPVQWLVIRGTTSFLWCTASLSSVVSVHGLNLHQYADDCQQYLSVPVDDVPSAVTRLSQCIADVAEWLSASHLRLNPDKTVIMWLGSKRQVEKVTIHDIPVLQCWGDARQSADYVGTSRRCVSISI